jgi:hypothetical protein
MDFIATIDFIISFLDFLIMAAEDRLSEAEPRKNPSGSPV